MEAELAKIYGNKVRVRACGICWRENQLLMVCHKAVTETRFWSPPGGGVEFGDSIEATVKKEFMEETGLAISVGSFLFGCEYIEKPIHAIELFYNVSIQGGSLRCGFDPEFQIIELVKFMDFEEIKKMPVSEVHGVFRITETSDDLKHLRGFYRI
jgi:8-oxo-dGTP diphosphatase